MGSPPWNRGPFGYSGGVPLREASGTLGFVLPEDDYDTVAGFVFGQLNRIPRVGDEVRVDNGTLRVLEMKGRRVEYLLFTPRVEL